VSKLSNDFKKTLSGIDARLIKRYDRIICEHMNVSGAAHAGLKALPDKISSFASTQAAWRFYQNEAVTLQKLQEPLTAAAHKGIETRCDQYGLCLHDWSRISYKHKNKQDTYEVTHATDIGYDLQSSLLVSDRDGEPLAPLAQRLVSADGSYATYYDDSEAHLPAKPHLDEVTDCIESLKQQRFKKPLVHVIDREADSVGHIRQWESNGMHWLVRVKDNPRVEYLGKPTACQSVAEALTYKPTREVIHQGQSATQWIASTAVRLTRPATPSQKKERKRSIPGAPIEARLVVSRVFSDRGELLAQWLLLTNVDQDEVGASTIALWYYWRWKIESFFKLLKSAGHHLESWQQASAPAIAKRLLVASMACVTVWAIAADESQEGKGLRSFLMKLSGRQTKRKKPDTHPALLAGLWVLLSMMEVMAAYSPEELDSFKSTAQKYLRGEDV